MFRLHSQSVALKLVQSVALKIWRFKDFAKSSMGSYDNLHLLFILLYLSVCSIWRSWNLTTSSCFEKIRKKKRRRRRRIDQRKGPKWWSIVLEMWVKSLESWSIICLHEKAYGSFLTINIILAWNCSKRFFPSNWSSSRSVSPKSRRKWLTVGHMLN